MKGRYFKFFLPIIMGIFLLSFAVPSTVKADDSEEQTEDGEYGSITVCKIIIDQDDNIVNGSQLPGTQFSISGIDPAVTSEAPPTGVIGTASFTTPLSFTTSILGGGNDAQCQTFGDLELGSYYYGAESINLPTGWATPKYNDQFTVAVNSIADFFNYDGNLFDGDSSNDEARNKNADGHIVLTSERPDRTLIILNQLVSTPPTGGGGPSVGGGGGGPTCPTDRPQPVDQVWFSDIGPNEVTVHWANKGDAAGFQIAYGPSQNNLIWGVEVNDPNATQFTIHDLPGGDLWVSVIAKSSKECGGPSSPVVKAQVGPQVLGAAGIANSAILFSAGFGLIALGLWQTQRRLSTTPI